MEKPQALPGLRRNPFGLGLIAFWLIYLGLLAYGVDSLYGYVVARLP